MYGPDLLVRFLETPTAPDKWGVRWQYNSRSDRHSKIGCWGIALDLLTTSSLLRSHAESGKVVLGVNHTMRDFSTSRKKDLDLVIARPASPPEEDGPTFAGLVDRFGIQLSPEEQAILATLPDLRIAPVGAVLVALEAKACMTAHVKALPRIYDELNSSHLCIHGASKQALAIAYVQVNAAREFLSSVKNPKDDALVRPDFTKHRQPTDTQRVITKVGEIPRRSASSEVGFDGIGITVVDFRNDGGPVKVVDGTPAPRPDDPFFYASMIVRMSSEYDATFAKI
ncbi:hypothetical protein [Pseudonocardia alni]|uniref:hypothetical protein n=1 Tax=Pseudonocardia alni TaxID=33907 RepID=UPI0033F88090